MIIYPLCCAERILFWGCCYLQWRILLYPWSVFPDWFPRMGAAPNCGGALGGAFYSLTKSDNRTERCIAHRTNEKPKWSSDDYDDNDEQQIRKVILLLKTNRRATTTMAINGWQQLMMTAMMISGGMCCCCVGGRCFLQCWRPFMMIIWAKWPYHHDCCSATVKLTDWPETMAAYMWCDNLGQMPKQWVCSV